MPTTKIQINTGLNDTGVVQTIAALRQSAIAAGQSEAKFLELAGALSLAALKAGDAARADQLLADANRGLVVSAQQAGNAMLEAATKGERAIVQEATARAGLARAQDASRDGLTGLIQAERLYADALARINPNTLEAIRLQTQLASVQNQVATGGRGAGALPRTLDAFGTQAIDQFKSSLLGIVGPAALVTAGFAAAGKAVEFFQDSFKFKAELDQSQAAVTTLLHGVRDSSQAFDEARQFATRYKLTQQETTEAINDSIPVIRNSKSSISDILSVFTRLTILKPGKTFQDASRAIAELQAGQAVSLEKIFNVPIDKANALKKEIEGGGDAIQVLNRFLTDSGVGMSALEIRTRGATGALNDQRIAYEKLKLAAGGASGGPGLAITQATTAVASQSADILGGQGQTIASQKFGEVARLFGVSKEKADSFGLSLARLGGYTNSAAETTQLAAGIFDEERSALGRAQIAADAAKEAEQRRVNVLNDARIAGAAAADAFRMQAKEIDASAEKSVLDTAAKDAQQAKTALVAARTNDAAAAFLSLNPTLDQAGVLSLLAAGQLDPLLGQLLLLKFRAQEARAALTGDKLQAQTARQLTGAASDEAGIRAGKHAGAVAGRAQGQAQAAAAAEALRQSQSAAGNLTPALTHAQAELNQLAKDGKQNTAEYINKQQEVANLQEQQATQGKKSLDDQIAYAKATGDTATARKLLNQELADAKATGNLGEQARILDAIKGLDKGGPKGVGASDRADIALAGAGLEGLDKQKARLAEINSLLEKGKLNDLQRKQLTAEKLDLETKVRDAIVSQYEASLDASALAIKDRQQDRKDAVDIKAANAIIKALGDRQDARAVDLRGRAEDARALIDVEDKKRALDLGQKQAKAGGAPVDLSALPTSSAPASAAPVGAAPGPLNAPQAAAAPQGGGSQTFILRLVDSAGKTLAETVEPFIMDSLMHGIRVAAIAKGA